MWPPPLLRSPRSSSGRGRRARQVAGDRHADVAGVHPGESAGTRPPICSGCEHDTGRSALAGSWTRALAERVMRPSEPLVHPCLRAPKAGAASAHVTALAAARTQRQGCGMLWFFAVAAATGAALWGAVRIEQSAGPVPVGGSGPGSAGKARRCRARRRPPAGRQAAAHASLRRPLRGCASRWGSRRSRAPAAKPVSAPPCWLSADRCTTTRVNSPRDVMPIMRNTGAGGVCAPRQPRVRPAHCRLAR
jgi:hypothetical protein